MEMQGFLPLSAARSIGYRTAVWTWKTMAMAKRPFE